MSYGCCLICSTCDTFEPVAGTHINKRNLLKDDLKCYISPPNNESKFLKRISHYILNLYVVMLLVPLFGGIRILLVRQCICK